MRKILATVTVTAVLFGRIETIYLLISGLLPTSVQITTLNHYKWVGSKLINPKNHDFLDLHTRRAGIPHSKSFACRIN